MILSRFKSEQGLGTATSLSPVFFLMMLTLAGALILTLSGCREQDAGTPVDPKTALVKRGRGTYQAVCTACHNTNPKVAGSLGPDVYGSSKELLEARILRKAYPPGYQPKRPTSVMPAFPQLQAEIDAVHAYLNSELH